MNIRFCSLKYFYGASYYVLSPNNSTLDHTASGVYGRGLSGLGLRHSMMPHISISNNRNVCTNTERRVLKEMLAVHASSKREHCIGFQFKTECMQPESARTTLAFNFLKVLAPHWVSIKTDRACRRACLSTLTFTHTVSLTISLSHSLSLSRSLSLSMPHSLSRSHSHYFSLAHSDSVSLSLTLS